MAKLVLLGTYWNEAEWIDRSLAQIDSISPDLSILCDGCFDSEKENYSTDGTRKKIEIYCNRNNGSYMFSAVRRSRFDSIFYLLKFGLKRRFSLALLYILAKHAIRTNKYRLNQAVTFCQMLELALDKLGDDIWIMTYDADQFYDDSYVSDFKKVINSLNGSNIGLLTAKEMTFNRSFECYTKNYEKRTWNNLPHKLYSNTMILPTRDIVRINQFSIKKYIDCVDEKKLGYYFHYKFRINKERDLMTYQLGDRKPPSSDRVNDEINFKGEHPKVISAI